MNAPSASPFAIETRALNLWYASFQALKDVTVGIRHGQITSLIGPSGCGKTTLLRCFNRVNERYGEVIEIGTNDVIFSDTPVQRKTYDYVNGLFG